jgi:hypothetical protein
LAQLLGIIHVPVPSQAAVHRLPQQIGQWELCVLTPTGIGQLLPDEFAESQAFVQLLDENQATIGGDSRTLGSTFKEALKES